MYVHDKLNFQVHVNDFQVAWKICLAPRLFQELDIRKAPERMITLYMFLSCDRHF